MGNLPTGFYDDWWQKLRELRAQAPHIDAEILVGKTESELLQLMLRERLAAFAATVRQYQLIIDGAQTTEYFRQCLATEWRRAGWSEHKIRITLTSYGMRLDAHNILGNAVIIHLPTA